VRLTYPPPSQSDHDLFVGDEFLHAEIVDGIDDLGAPFVGEPGFELVEILSNDVHDEALIAEDGFMPCDFLDQGNVVASELFDFEPGEFL